MLEQLHTQIRTLLQAGDDPRRLFRDLPSAPLAALAEATYQVAFWSAYERNRRGEQTDMLLRLNRDELWSMATKLPLPAPPPADPAEDRSWLLEAAGDVLEAARTPEGLRDGLSASELQTLLAQLGEALTLVRRELRRRGQAVAPVQPVPAGDGWRSL